MENSGTPDHIPPQQEGLQSDISAGKVLDTEVIAAQFFEKAAQRLLDVNKWGSYTGMLTADFQLCDNKGNEVQRTVQMYDYFRIDIPGPGSAAGDGYDWVQVEALERFLSPEEELLLIRVRPVANPKSEKNDVAHFFTDDSTSSFIIRRKGNKVTAEVHGRNEKPNLLTDSLLDKARNVFTGVVAASLFSKYQWKSLTEGLLNFEL